MCISLPPDPDDVRITCSPFPVWTVEQMAQNVCRSSQLLESGRHLDSHLFPGCDEPQTSSSVSILSLPVQKAMNQILFIATLWTARHESLTQTCIIGPSTGQGLRRTHRFGVEYSMVRAKILIPDISSINFSRLLFPHPLVAIYNSKSGKINVLTVFVLLTSHWISETQKQDEREGHSLIGRF